MTFLWPQFLWLLPTLTAVTLLVWFLAERRRARHAGDLADARLYDAVVRRPGRFRTRLVRALQLAALVALLVAAGRPVAAPPLPGNRAAVVIALDASRSMLATDAAPNRLDAAREVARSFVEQAPASALLGLASFSDSAFVLVPPTRAREEILEALERVRPASNTSLASAIVAGVRMLPGREQARPPDPLGATAAPTENGRPPQPPATATELPPGRLLVLSDGVTNVASTPGLASDEALELAITFAREQQVEIHTVPFGKEGGTVARIDGRDWFVPFDASTLDLLANETGGSRLDPGDAARLREAFEDLGTAIRWEPTEIEAAAILSATAAALLLAAAALGLSTTRRVP